MIATVLGTRPEIIKMSRLIPMLDTSFDHTLIYTAQHYSPNMSDVFFEELGVRTPDVNLHADSSDPGALKARVLATLEKLRPDYVLAHGDTNTALAAALAARELRIPVIHAEGGGRSFDARMPEEANRKQVDHLSEIIFTETQFSKRQLAREGITRNVFVVGLTSVDIALRNREKAAKSQALKRLELAPRGYSLLTMHRHENIDDRECLARLLSAFREVPGKIVWPVHPHTQKNMDEWGLAAPANVLSIPPQGSMDFLKLLMEAKMLLTDSGGAVQEAVALKVPCLMIRDSTEMQETMMNGNCILTGTNPRLISYFARMIEETELGERMRRAKNPYGDGTTSEKIHAILVRKLGEKKTKRARPKAPAGFASS